MVVYATHACKIHIHSVPAVNITAAVHHASIAITSTVLFSGFSLTSCTAVSTPSIKCSIFVSLYMSSKFSS